jgi:predicted dehydrogenase
VQAAPAESGGRLVQDLRVIVVGCGAMSVAWLRAAAEIDGLKIIGLADLDRDRAAARAAEFQLDVPIESDAVALIERLKPDLVFDVVVPEARRDIVLAAFQRGCHVLSEKPLADTLDHAKELVAAARAAGRVHAVIQNRRYFAGTRRVQRFVASGAIGRVTALHCDFFVGPHFGGFREQMEHVLLIDMAVHTFDMARAIAGATPVAVYCQENNPVNSWFKHGAAANAIFEFADGAVFNYRGSWSAEGLRTSWQGAWRLIGTEGTVVWDGEEDFRAERPTSSGGLIRDVEPIAVPPLDPADAIGGHAGVIRDFVVAAREGRELETVSHENIKSLAMCFAAIDSATTGRRALLDLKGLE